MSKLAVGIIESSDVLTDLVFTTANTNSGNIRVFSANDTILFSGTPRFTGPVPVASDAFTQANTARNQGNSAFTQANVSFAQANTAFDKANTGASTGKAIAMAIVFGG